MASAAAAPVPAATLVLLRDAAAGPEVLLLRRSRATRFAPGFYVFPGGRVDSSDGDGALARLWDGLDPAAARARLGLGPGAIPSALAYYGAAIREAFEETGVVACAVAEGGSAKGGSVDAPWTRPVAGPVAGVPTGRAVWSAPDGSATDRSARPCPVSAARKSLLDGGESLARVLRRLRLRLDGGALEYVAHWVTPASSPRRYDTRFFATAVPFDARVVEDQREVVEAVWLSPRDALVRHRDGALPLMRPTRRTLEDFRAFSSVDALLSAYRHRTVPRIEPNPGPQ